jgi:tetratricopeptide (TPR) repeat protein
LPDAGETFVGDASAPLPIELTPGAMVDGKYRIVEKLAVGGMGIVYLALQTRPLQRNVALKVIKPGMDTEQVVARFEAERQALARMDHPNIARIYDAGATEAGRPYFAMELVEGAPLTQYCDRRLLSVRERLELFLPICEAVQHAHQRGLIHRDLKPSNVLVALRDGRPVPKIIDFGIARATHRSLGESTFATEQGQLVGTPEYMSPEQADPYAVDVDTRADVYSLGALLYELLAGAMPFDAGKLRTSSLADMQRLIQEVEPLRPSARVIDLATRQAAVATTRASDPRSLKRSLRGDLDWIVMKAMAKDRARRYPSASELGEDVARHLRHEPVTAGPPDAAYRLSKFVRRHRAGVGLGLAVLAAVLVGLAGVVDGLVRSQEAERRARGAEARAREEARASLQVSQFLEGLFRVSDPGEARGRTVTAREILDRGASRVASELADQPALQARLMLTIGRVYASLGLYREAISLFEGALERRAELPDDLETAEAFRQLGEAHTQRGEYELATSLLERSLSIADGLVQSASPSVADALDDLGTICLRTGDYDRGQALLERALRIRETVLPADHPDLATSLNNLGAIHYRKGNVGMARALWERALAIREAAFGPDHHLVARTLNNLALLDVAVDDYGTARSRLERVVHIQEQVLGPRHTDLASALSNLGDVLIREGAHAQALPLLQRAVGIEEAAVGPNHPELARFLERLGTATLFGSGDVSRARELFERSLAMRRALLGEADQELTDSVVGLANCERRAGRPDAARAFFERALTLNRRADGSYHPLATGVLYYYAEFLRENRDPKRASELEALETTLVEQARRRTP